MVDNIAAKALNSERTLQRKQVVNEEPLAKVPIRVISSYGSDDDLVNVVQKYVPHLKRTRSFSEGDQNLEQLAPQHKKNTLFQFVKKTGSTLRSRLLTSKQLALGARHGQTKQCRRKNCKCCRMIFEEDFTTVNKKKVKSAPGNCKTYNIIYLVQCSMCEKAYVGRSVNSLNVRMDGHRSKFYEIIDGRAIDITKDEYSLGIHLLDHGLENHADFETNFKTFILENCSPKVLEEKENKYIHLLKTLRPLGLNTINPFGLEIFHN